MQMICFPKIYLQVSTHSTYMYVHQITTQVGGHVNGNTNMYMYMYVIYIQPS